MISSDEILLLPGQGYLVVYMEPWENTACESKEIS